jgi:chemotaxis protein histidine kinase CheA
VVHGIETKEERESLGKNAQGTITLTTKADQENFMLSYMDDGRGINSEKIRTVASKHPKFQHLELEKMSQGQLVGMIFQPGFSTAPSRGLKCWPRDRDGYGQKQS